MLAMGIIKDSHREWSTFTFIHLHFYPKAIYKWGISQAICHMESRLALTGVLSRYSLSLDMNKWGPVKQFLWSFTTCRMKRLTTKYIYVFFSFSVHFHVPLYSSWLSLSSLWGKQFPSFQLVAYCWEEGLYLDYTGEANAVKTHKHRETTLW